MNVITCFAMATPYAWPKANGEKFIREAIKFWNDWG